MGFTTGDRDNQSEWTDWDNTDVRGWNLWRRLQYLFQRNDPYVQHTFSFSSKPRVSDDSSANVLGGEVIHPRNDNQRRDSYRFDGNVELWSDYL